MYRLCTCTCAASHTLHPHTLHTFTPSHITPSHITHTHIVTHVQLDAPLFITMSQCIVAVVVFVILMSVSKFRPGSVNFPPLELDCTILLKVG